MKPLHQFSLIMVLAFGYVVAASLYCSAQHIHQQIRNMEGVWAGTLLIYQAEKGLVDSAKIELNIIPISYNKPDNREWKWQTIFESTKYGKITKDYLLKAHQDSAYRYNLDEQNGILLPSFLLGSALYTRYELAPQDWYMSCYELLPDGFTLRYEVVFGTNTPKTKHQSTVGTQTYTILGLGTSGSQRAYLTRKKRK